MLTAHGGIYGERARSEGGAGGKPEGQSPDSLPDTGLPADTFPNVLATHALFLLGGVLEHLRYLASLIKK